MNLADTLDLVMFAVTCAVLLSGFPVAFTLGGVALIFALIGLWFGIFDFGYLLALPQRIFGTMTNEALVAVPLFVFMGTMLERSKVAEELLENMSRLFGAMRGGLGISVTIVGAMLAASTGIVGATVVTMGLLALPTMLRRGYDPALATGSIAAAGTLGQIIPPSIILVLLGDVLANAYSSAQLEMGIFTPDTMSVGDLFAGAIIPGFVLVGLYILYQSLRALLDPASSPAVPHEDADEPASVIIRRTLSALFPPMILIVAVLGSILAGIATPTEAAAVGAVGATLLAGYRQLENKKPAIIAASALLGIIVLTSFADLRVARENLTGGEYVGIAVAFALCAAMIWGMALSLIRLYRRDILSSVMQSTARISSMVFVILIGAALFSLVFRGLGGDETVQAFLTFEETSLLYQIFGDMAPIVVVMFIMFILGFFLDFIEITFVVVPIVGPILLALGFDPVWLGVMMAINLQTSFLTPPFGFALFYLRGVAPESVRTVQIYRGAIPFVIIQLLALVILSLYPPLATWLPDLVFG